MYDVVLAPEAKIAYARAERPLARKLARAFRALEADPLRHPNVKRLVGPLKGLLRFRVGDYRIVYQVDIRKGVVYVVRIANRKEVYD